MVLAKPTTGVAREGSKDRRPSRTTRRVTVDQRLGESAFQLGAALADRIEDAFAAGALRRFGLEAQAASAGLHLDGIERETAGRREDARRRVVLDEGRGFTADRGANGDRGEPRFDEAIVCFDAPPGFDALHAIDESYAGGPRRLTRRNRRAPVLRLDEGVGVAVLLFCFFGVDVEGGAVFDGPGVNSEARSSRRGGRLEHDF